MRKIFVGKRYRMKWQDLGFYSFGCGNVLIVSRRKVNDFDNNSFGELGRVKLHVCSRRCVRFFSCRYRANECTSDSPNLRLRDCLELACYVHVGVDCLFNDSVAIVSNTANVERHLVSSGRFGLDARSGYHTRES